MTIYSEGRTMDAGNEKPAGDAPCILVGSNAEEAQALALAGITPSGNAFPSRGTKYESLEGYDFFALQMPDLEAPGQTAAVVHMYLTAHCLVVLCEDGAMRAALQAEIGKLPESQRLPHLVLHLFFSLLLSGDNEKLEEIEDIIECMEERALRKPPEDDTRDVIELRKKLLALKRYYEALYDLLGDLEENPNRFIPADHIRYFRLHTNRADRLLSNINNLRDYLTQVREAYQNQLDISLNETMRIFTVVTAVFLPLTLVTGWYGMNLHMPEYQLPWLYPVIIIVCILVVLVCLWYFKRKHWF